MKTRLPESMVILIKPCSEHAQICTIPCIVDTYKTFLAKNIGLYLITAEVRWICSFLKRHHTTLSLLEPHYI